MKRMLPIIAVLFLGCQPPAPQTEPEPPTQEQIELSQNKVVSQIELMGMAADGQEFIAYPPTSHYEHVALVMRSREMKTWYIDMMTAWAEAVKEEGGITEEDYKAHIDKWNKMSKTDLRKEWASGNFTGN